MSRGKVTQYVDSAAGRLHQIAYSTTSKEYHCELVEYGFIHTQLPPLPFPKYVS